MHGTKRTRFRSGLGEITQAALVGDVGLGLFDSRYLAAIPRRISAEEASCAPTGVWPGGRGYPRVWGVSGSAKRVSWAPTFVPHVALAN